MPEEVQKVIEEELSRISVCKSFAPVCQCWCRRDLGSVWPGLPQAMEPHSMEFSVTRNYLDWLTCIPWGWVFTSFAACCSFHVPVVVTGCSFTACCRSVHTSENFDIAQAKAILEKVTGIFPSVHAFFPPELG